MSARARLQKLNRKQLEAVAKRLSPHFRARTWRKFNDNEFRDFVLGMLKGTAERRGVRLNPSPRDAIERADSLLESFSGSRASKELRVRQRPIKTGLVVGPMIGVMYEADRGDGKHNYFHRFSRKARPLLVADHDGSQLGIVGGRFRFTDHGIEDET